MTPKRHDDICRATGEHDSLCPPDALIARGDAGQFLKRTSGNKVGLKSLREARKYIRAKCDGKGGEAIVDRLWEMAGIDKSGAQFKDTVQVRALIKLADVFFGKEIRKHVEHSGTVTHEAKVAPMRPVSVLSDAQLAALEDALKALEEHPTPSGVEDAEIIEEGEG